MIFGTHVYENVQINKQFQLINKVKTTIKCNLHFCIKSTLSNTKTVLNTMLSGRISITVGKQEFYFRQTKGKERHTLSKNHTRSLTQQPDIRSQHGPSHGLPIALQVAAFHCLPVLWGLSGQNWSTSCQQTPACYPAGHTYRHTTHCPQSTRERRKKTNK